MNRKERISQTDAVVDELKRFFLSNAIEVGDKLPTEKQLCEKYRVGRSTVREAIRTLQVMRYVELRPGRGAFLSAKSLAGVDATLAAWVAEHKPGLEETVRIRQALEGVAIAFAIEKASDAEIQSVELARLAFEEALARKDNLELSDLDEAFHRAFVRISHSELLVTLNTVVSMAFREWRERSFRYEEYAATAVIPHQRIAAALLARDGELARLQVRRHLDLVLADMIETMQAAHVSAGKR